ncbi:MAG: LCP family protein [Anaerolineae bacterium]
MMLKSLRWLAAALLGCFLLGTTPLYAQTETPPDPMPLLDEGEYDIENFLLMGADQSNPNNLGRTDALMIVSVNMTVGTASFLSIPRDLWVYIPNIGTAKINTAYASGVNSGGSGIELLSDTIRYNLGIQIDHYARINFSGFKELVDALGGIEVAVDCAIQDWRLREPDLDPTVEDNWEMFTLPVGMQSMDGNLALWYARSRRTSSDFDRGRRQQVIMRAIWQRIRALNLWDQATDIFPQLTELVTTDLSTQDMLRYVPLAATIDSSRIAAYTFRPNVEVTFSQSVDGQSILLPVRESITTLEQQMMQPPTESELVREHANIEVVNASGIPGLGRVAVERLSWEGFVPQLSQETPPFQSAMTLYDFTGQRKGGSLQVLSQVLRVSPDSVIIQPDPNRTVDFRVIIGGDYHTCTHNVLLPTETPTTESSGG